MKIKHEKSGRETNIAQGKGKCSRQLFECCILYSMSKAVLLSRSACMKPFVTHFGTFKQSNLLWIMVGLTLKTRCSAFPFSFCLVVPCYWTGLGLSSEPKSLPLNCNREKDILYTCTDYIWSCMHSHILHEHIFRNGKWVFIKVPVHK